MQKLDLLHSASHSALQPTAPGNTPPEGSTDAKTAEIGKTILDLPLEMRCEVFKRLDLPDLLRIITTSTAGYLAGTHNEVWASVASRLGIPLNHESRYFDQVAAYLVDVHSKADKKLEIPAVQDLTIEDVKTLAAWVKAHDTLIVWDALSQKANQLNPALNLVIPLQLNSDDKLKVIEEAAKFPTWFRDNKNAINGLLTDLNLSEKSLVSLPGELFELTGLEKLDLSATRLSTLPSEIGNLVNLKTLNVSNSDLISIPKEIGELAALETLNLSNNRIEHLPPQIGNNTRLKFLSASDNALKSLPDEIGLLTQLKFFLLRNNQLTTLPPATAKLTLLANLQLEKNPLESLPPELLALPNLRRVVQIESAKRAPLNLDA